VAAAQQQQTVQVRVQHSSVVYSWCVLTVLSPGVIALSFVVWSRCSVEEWQRRQQAGRDFSATLDRNKQQSCEAHDSSSKRVVNTE